jgi:hypothetical protein
VLIDSYINRAIGGFIGGVSYTRRVELLFGFTLSKEVY